eukprot:TRINITY_DN115911_c0_g1_i1.p1 TRINITY_DN115911_c0_g1~~TRINITY_DN115911_c0_g1_i1.p1  ORF type:complete len:573 (-),score=93.62 TRINITY_DN115911_c0_g1_i1:85-1803(-)
MERIDTVESGSDASGDEDGGQKKEEVHNPAEEKDDGEPKRKIPIPVHMSWSKLVTIASGCMGEQIVASKSRKGIRLNNASKADKRDPLKIMQTGVHVLFYEPKGRKFENRVLKIDSRLSFLFCLQEKAQLHHQKNVVEDPFCVRLHEIDDVSHSGSAMRICEQLGVHDDYVTEATAVVIHHGGKSGKDVVTFDKACVIIAPPQQALKGLLDAVIKLAKKVSANDEGDAEGLLLKDQGRYLDCARIRKVAPVFTEEPTVELELTLRSDEDLFAKAQDEDTKKPLHHAVHMPLDPDMVGHEVHRLQDRLGIMPALDVARLSLVLYDMAMHRLWCTGQVGIFPGGLYEFMQDSIATTKHLNLDPFVVEKLTAVPPKTRRSIDMRVYAKRAMTATVLAIKHLIELEECFSNAEQGILRRPVEVFEVAESEGSSSSASSVISSVLSAAESDADAPLGVQGTPRPEPFQSELPAITEGDVGEVEDPEVSEPAPAERPTADSSLRDSANGGVAPPAGSRQEGEEEVPGDREGTGGLSAEDSQQPFLTLTKHTDSKDEEHSDSHSRSDFDEKDIEVFRAI